MGESILVIEDEEAIAAFVQTTLEQEGFTVEMVGNGEPRPLSRRSGKGAAALPCCLGGPRARLGDCRDDRDSRFRRVESIPASDRIAVGESGLSSGRPGTDPRPHRRERKPRVLSSLDQRAGPRAAHSVDSDPGPRQILGSCQPERDEALWRRSRDFIASEAERLARLVEDLLRLSRLDLMPLQWLPVNLRAVAEEAVSALIQAAEARGVQLALQSPPSLPRILGDRDRLYQVFVNLLDNAIKYSSAGGNLICHLWIFHCLPNVYMPVIRRLQSYGILGSNGTLPFLTSIHPTRWRWRDERAYRQRTGTLPYPGTDWHWRDGHCLQGLSPCYRPLCGRQDPLRADEWRQRTAQALSARVQGHCQARARPHPPRLRLWACRRSTLPGNALHRGGYSQGAVSPRANEPLTREPHHRAGR
jgi:hypothetical protein